LLIITIGISGSGKNYLLVSLKDNLNIVNIEPDDIRRKKLGNVNNQENGGMIFSIAKNMINKALKENKDVFFNGTNLDWKRTINFILDLNKSPEISVLFVYLKDSLNLDICKKRVLEDINNNIDRSNVPEDIIEKQYERYKTCIHNIYNHPNLSIDKCPKNWKVFGYQNNLDELIYTIENLKKWKYLKK
jgi:predicted kinase